MFQFQKLCLAFFVLSPVLGKPFNNSDIQPKWNNRGQVVFLGDSITEWWRNDGKEIWDQFYEQLGAVNTGVAGDKTTTIIDRINQEGILDNLNVYLAVLKIGTNDLSNNVAEDTVAQNIATIISQIQWKNPGVKILLLGILPRGGWEIHSKIRNVNAIISDFANGQNVFFLDMEQQFSFGVGEVVPELFWEDQLHLSTAGYATWAQTMGPTFNEILNSPFSAKAVWVGDSLTEQWILPQYHGLPVWNQFYTSIESLNVGKSEYTSGQTIDRILWEGVLDNLNSKVAVLLIGGNDLRWGAQAPEIIANIETIIQLIRERLPHGRILLLGLLPAGGMPDWLIEQGKIVNEALARMENFDDIRFLEMRREFADENDNVYPELYDFDYMHLSRLGYEVWQRTMDPLFQELLRF